MLDNLDHLAAATPVDGGMLIIDNPENPLLDELMVPREPEQQVLGNTDAAFENGTDPAAPEPEKVYGVKEAKADFDLVWRRERNQVTRQGKTRMSRVRKWLAEQVVEDLI